MADIKDYTKSIEGVGEMGIDQLHELYSQMLATAHDISYQAPDEQLVETDDPDVLRKIIPPLHRGIVKFNAGLDTPRAESAGGKKPRAANGQAKPPAKKAVTKKAPAKKTVAAKPAAEPESTETQQGDSDMSTATARKAPAKKGATAKKAAAKKGATKKASKANARTPVTRNKWSEKAKIKVLVEENPCRKGTGRFDRVANLIKHDGKLVSDYLAKGGRSGSLAYSEAQGWVKVIG